MAMPDACVFCGGVPLDREHLLGDWMNRRLPIGGVSQHFVGATPGPMETHRSDKHDQVVPCVCGPCNHGWMSNLETTIAPFLTQVATGIEQHVPERAYLTTALWAVKSVLVKQYQAPQPDPLLIPPEQYAYVYRFLQPPPNTVVYQGFGPLIFPLPGLGDVAVDGVILTGREGEVKVGDATLTLTGWQGWVGKGQFHCVVASVPRHPQDPTGHAPAQIVDGGSNLVKIWPLETKEGQIRVRHPRVRALRHGSPGRHDDAP